MIKAKKYDWKDSNRQPEEEVANQKKPTRAFDEAGKENGIEIWRIEKFEVVPYPQEKYGQFHTGDSYIVLSTADVHSKRPSWDIYFWIGKQSTQDEYGTAAYKSVELDTTLGDYPAQHREVQGHESDSFLSLFKQGIIYLPGGVGTGFRRVLPEAYEKRLFVVQGEGYKPCRATQVAIKACNISKSDCAILDDGKKIFVYVPPGASKMEQEKATQVAKQFKAGRGSATLEIINEQRGDNVNPFFDALGISADEVPETTVVDDGESENAVNRDAKLCKVSDASGSLEISEVSGMPLTQDMLSAEDCFILDTGKSGGDAWSGIFVRIGRRSSPDEKIGAMKAAQDYIAKNNLPFWTHITTVREGSETTMFKQYFKVWQDAEDTTLNTLSRTYNVGSTAE